MYFSARYFLGETNEAIAYSLYLDPASKDTINKVNINDNVEKLLPKTLHTNSPICVFPVRHDIVSITAEETAIMHEARYAFFML